MFYLDLQIKNKVKLILPILQTTTDMAPLQKSTEQKTMPWKGPHTNKVGNNWLLFAYRFKLSWVQI